MLSLIICSLPLLGLFFLFAGMLIKVIFSLTLYALYVIFVLPIKFILKIISFFKIKKGE